MTDTRDDHSVVRAQGVSEEMHTAASLRAKGLGQGQVAIIRVLAKAILDRHRRQNADCQVGSSHRS